MKKLLILFGLCTLASPLIFAADDSVNSANDEGMSMALTRIEAIKENVNDFKDELEEASKDPNISKDTHEKLKDLIHKLDKQQERVEKHKKKFEERRSKWQSKRDKHISKKVKNINITIDEIDDILKDPKVKEDKELSSDLEKLKTFLTNAKERLESIKGMKGQGYHGKRGWNTDNN